MSVRVRQTIYIQGVKDSSNENTIGQGPSSDHRLAFRHWENDNDTLVKQTEVFGDPEIYKVDQKDRQITVVRKADESRLVTVFLK